MKGILIMYGWFPWA